VLGTCLKWSISIFFVNILLLLSFLYIYPTIYPLIPLPDDGSYAAALKVITSKHIYLRSTDAHLHVNEAGPDSGDLIIFIHGFPETGLVSWKHQIPFFAKLGYKVVAPDNRCFNTSTNFNSVNLCNSLRSSYDVNAIIEFYKREKAIIVGHDWGGMVAWLFADNFPERVDKLVILGIPHPEIFLQAYKYAPIQLLRSSYFFYFSAPFLPEWTFSIHKNYWFKVLLNSSPPKVLYNAEDFKRLEKAWTNTSGMFNWYRAAVRDIFSGKTRKFNVVTSKAKLIFPKEDTALDWRLAEPSKSLCKDLEVTYYPGAGHFFHRHKHAEVNNEIATFLKKK